MNVVRDTCLGVIATVCALGAATYGLNEYAAYKRITTTADKMFKELGNSEYLYDKEVFRAALVRTEQSQLPRIAQCWEGAQTLQGTNWTWAASCAVMVSPH